MVLGAERLQVGCVAHDELAVLVDIEHAVVYPRGEDGLRAELGLERVVELDVESVDRRQFLDFEHFADVLAVFRMDAEAFQVVDVVLALGCGEPLRFRNHHVAVHEMHK